MQHTNTVSFAATFFSYSFKLEYYYYEAKKGKIYGVCTTNAEQLFDCTTAPFIVAPPIHQFSRSQIPTTIAANGSQCAAA